MEISGRIKHIGDVQEFGANGFRRRDLVVTTDEQYPQPILVEFTQDNVNVLDEFKVGEHVVVSINIRGRQWTAPTGEIRHFNVFNAWNIMRK